MEQAEQKNKYISLAEASSLTPYSQEYLSLRARQGKLRAKKVGQDWATTKEWVDEYLVRSGANGVLSDKKAEEEYISLREAATHTKYSQEYLSLRVRQGKLRATKIGRNWVTTKRWVEEYEQKIKEAKTRKPATEKPTTEGLMAAEAEKTRGVDRTKIKENLWTSDVWDSGAS
ncbi:hypothetical protein KJ784_03210, partial [Patescibacteria group bacterium]|nr:hypothetical protein [Patescibacteria group bacterium]